MSDNAEALAQVAQKLENFNESPLYEYRQKNQYQSVPGEGNANAEVIFIGEAPGKQEAETGRPFVGSGGKLLDDLFDASGLSRDDFFITNLVKDRPPENRDPTEEEIKAYEPFLWRQIEIIQPRMIVTLGRFAMQFMLSAFNHPQKDRKISEIHGNLLQGKIDYGEVYLLPLYHPAAALYNRALEPILQEDMKVVKAFLENEK